jgi:hypothetical protein
VPVFTYTGLLKVYHQNSDGSVTYTDWEGNKVTYKDDVADFGPHSQKEVEIDEMVGDHYHDYKAANKKAGYGEGAYDHPDGTTWHHKDTTTMQNADSKIHERFTLSHTPYFMCLSMNQFIVAILR